MWLFGTAMPENLGNFLHHVVASRLLPRLRLLLTQGRESGAGQLYAHA
jgi:hypothetical protein